PPGGVTASGPADSDLCGPAGYSRPKIPPGKASGQIPPRLRARFTGQGLHAETKDRCVRAAFGTTFAGSRWPPSACCPQWRASGTARGLQAIPGLVGFQLGADPPGWTENLNCRNFAIPRRLT